MDDAFDAFFREARECLRNGTVGNDGWDDDGMPVGGHLTWDAIASMNDARYTLSDATGLDYDWLRANIG